MDQSSLKNSDVLILTGLTQMPTANPDGMLGEFCSNLGRSKKTVQSKRFTSAKHELIVVHVSSVDFQP